MTEETSFVAAATPLHLAKAQAAAAFKGFVGNAEAVHALERSLAYALATAPAGEPASLSETILLVGPPSTGKTDLARRITSALGLPFIWLDGKGIRSRERLFAMIDDALAAAKPPLSPLNRGSRPGVPIYEYPAFVACVDEIHLASTSVQESFLTMLEADDRSLLLESNGARRAADVARATFIFATTRPAELERAFRSRCNEIPLRRYTIDEIAQMVKARFGQMPDQHIAVIARCSRLTPRIAFAIAQDIKKEVYLSDDGVIGPCVSKVLAGRGIISRENGCTRDDVRYLRTLRKERRPLGERALSALLHDLDPLKITEDIEPHLLALGLVVMKPGGREITSDGIWFLKSVDSGG